MSNFSYLWRHSISNHNNLFPKQRKMKKFSLVLSFAAVAMFGFSSCGETCVECSYDLLGVTTTEEFCNEDETLVDAFQTSIEALDPNADCN